MDIEDLRIFVEVADAGGVSQAARRLGVAKSIVSRSLLRLETELGVQLLARTTRGTALTETGSAFRHHAAKIAAELDVARETILPEGELRGQLRISAPLTFGPTHFAPALAEMARRNPKLSLRTCYTDRFVDLVAEGFDCAIRVGYLPDSNLIARRIAPIQGKLVAGPGYVEAHGAPETPDELVRHEALMQGTEAWSFLDGEKVVTVRPQGRFRLDQPASSEDTRPYDDVESGNAIGFYSGVGRRNDKRCRGSGNADGLTSDLASRRSSPMGRRRLVGL